VRFRYKDTVSCKNLPAKYRKLAVLVRYVCIPKNVSSSKSKMTLNVKFSF